MRTLVHLSISRIRTLHAPCITPTIEVYSRKLPWERSRLGTREDDRCLGHPGQHRRRLQVAAARSNADPADTSRFVQPNVITLTLYAVEVLWTIRRSLHMVTIAVNRNGSAR